MWANFSIWLITVGLVFGTWAALAGLIDFIGNRAIRALWIAWAHMGLNVVVMILSTFNAFVHSRDGWTSVVPTGLTLTLIVFVLLLIGSLLPAFQSDRREVRA